MSRRKVAVIGSGPYGLAAMRHIKEVADVVCYERRAVIGGMWNHEEDPDKQPYITPVYDNLRLNTPVVCAGYSDFPMPKDTPPFPTFQDYIKYLNIYAENFSLEQYIQFNTLVVNVSKVGDKFLVQTKRECSEDPETTHDEYFDDVVVATGYYTNPIIPEYSGSDIYKGEALHSWRNRNPEKYRGKRVVVVGDQLSAWDISWDLSKHVEKVFVSHHTLPLFITLPENGEAIPAIGRYTETGVILSNGDHVPCDAVVYCTGYTPSFPFLDTSCKTVVKDGRVENLYKMIVHTKVPGLFFTGMYYYTSHGPLSYIQGAFIASIISGKTVLPTFEVMEAEIEKAFADFLTTGKKPRFFHSLDIKFDTYCKELEAFGTITKVSKPVLQSIMEYVFTWFLHDKDYITCRNRRLIPINDVEYKVVHE